MSDRLKEIQERELIERLEQTFPPDALERLIRAEQDYYRTHGHYVPGLAKLARHYLARLTEVETALRAWREAKHDAAVASSVGTYTSGDYDRLMAAEGALLALDGSAERTQAEPQNGET